MTIKQMKQISNAFSPLFSIPDQSHLNLFASRPQPKKKRKSRTAFTNNQIFELEKRFLYQKYLSPADRDEIAAALGLSNAQVSVLLPSRPTTQPRGLHKHLTDESPLSCPFAGHHMVPKSPSKTQTRHGGDEERHRDAEGAVGSAQNFFRKC